MGREVAHVETLTKVMAWGKVEKGPWGHCGGLSSSGQNLGV